MLKSLPVAGIVECQSRQSTDTSEPIIPVAVADTAAPTPPVSAGDAITAADDIPVAETETGVSGDCGASEDEPDDSPELIGGISATYSPDDNKLRVTNYLAQHFRNSFRFLL